MPRRSSRPSGGRRPAARAPARSSSSRAQPAPRSAAPRSAAPPSPQRRPAQNPSNAPAKQNSAAAPPPATATPGQPSAMGGFMANVASTGLGVMAGRAMDRAFFGGGGGSQPIDEAPPAEAPDSSYSSEYMLNGDEISPSVCAQEALEFKKCMEKNSSDLSSCKWNLDILAACQQQQEQSAGFADAGRF